MRNVPFGPVKEHRCPSRALTARPAANLPKEHLPAHKAAVPAEAGSCIPPQADHSLAEHQPLGPCSAACKIKPALSVSQILLSPCSGRSLKPMGFPVGKIN